MSLVRSNEAGKIGFLNVAGRVCVALSRARVGLFVVGNVVELSRKSGIWSSINAVVETDSAIGDSLELNCPFHPTTRKMLSPSDQTFETSFENFCDEVCGAILPRCDHKCQIQCHYDDRSHIETRKCHQQCERSCSEGHRCSKNCDQICSPCEWVNTEAIILNCGHQYFSKCRTVFEVPFCEVPVVKTFPCDHEKVTICSSQMADCDVVCDVVLKCRHACDLPCGKHENDKHQARCSKPCKKPKLGCRLVDLHPPCNKVRNCFLTFLLFCYHVLWLYSCETENQISHMQAKHLDIWYCKEANFNFQS